MSFTKFCPKCGKDTDTIVKGVCKDCYLGGNDLFTVKDIVIDLCGRCQKIRFGFNWTQRSDTEIINAITQKIKPVHELEQVKSFVDIEPNGDTSYKVKIKVVGILDDVLAEQEKDFILDLKKGICDPCMRLSSDYREAIIQLRTDKGPKEEQAIFELASGFIELEKQRNSLSGVVNTIKTKNGFDIWLGSGKAGAKISNKIGKMYNVKVVTTKKLIGESQGKRKFRYTFLIRH